MTIQGIRNEVFGNLRVAIFSLLALVTTVVGLPPSPAASAGEVDARLCPGTTAIRFPGQLTDLGAAPWLDHAIGCHATGSGLAGLYQDRGGAPAQFGQGARISWEAPPEVSIVEATGRVRMRDANGIRTSLVGRAGDSEQRVFDGTQLDGSDGSFVWPRSGMSGSSLAITIACDRPGGCPNRSDSIKAFAQVDRLEITGRDATPPSVELTGQPGGASGQGGWVRGSVGWRASAADAGTGLAEMRFQVNGYPLSTIKVPCLGLSAGVATELAPCPSSRNQTGVLDTSEPPFRDGVNSIRLCAADYSSDPATANRTCTPRTELKVDGRPPSSPVDLETDRGPEWSARGDFSLSWALPEDSGSPLDRAFYRLRATSTGRVVASGEMPADPAGAADRRQIEIPEPGAFRLEVGLIDLAGNSGPVASTQVRFDDRPPPDVTPLPSSGWISRSELPLRQAVSSVTGSGPSGISGFAITSSDLGPQMPCRARLCRLPELSWLGDSSSGPALIGGLAEGENFVSAVAVSGAMVPSHNPGHTKVSVDLTDPAVQVLGGKSEWSDRPVTLTALATDRLSGMAPEPEDDGLPLTGIGPEGTLPEIEEGNRATVTVTREGVTAVRYFARDLAGNSTGWIGSGEEGAIRTVVRIDSLPPSVRFGQLEDPLDPERVVAFVEDRSSGPAGGEISIRPTSGREGFRTLETTIEGGRLEARIPSDLLPEGEYELRAEATDLAGNRTVVMSDSVIDLPLKAESLISLGLGRPSPRGPAGSGMDSGPAVSGRLSVGQSGLETDASVIIEEVFDPGSGLAERRTTVPLGAAGSFSASLLAGPSRRVRAIFEGDRLNRRSSSRWVRIDSDDRVRFSIRDRFTRNGAPTRMTGVVSGPGLGLPVRGKKVVIQYFDPARATWRPVEVVTSGPSGRFVFTYRFRTIVSRQRILFRASSLGEVGWPFSPSSSRPVAVVVRP